MSRAINDTTYPSAIHAKLRSIRWRQAGLAAIRAIAIGASVLIGAMLVAMLADWWFTIFSTAVRTTLTVISVALAVSALLAVGIKPIAQAFGWSRAANVADTEVPQLEERWTTISHVTNSDHQPNSPVAQAMLQQVTSEAVAMGALVQPARVVRAARLKKVLLVAGGCTVLLLGFLAINWQQNTVLLQRFWAPAASISATKLESVTGDVTIPRGQTIDLVATLSGLPRGSATLVMMSDSDEPETVILTPNAESPDQFVYNLEVEQSFRYRVRAGDGQTEWHSITAIDPPELSEVRFTVKAPQYVVRPPYEKSIIPGRVKAIQGSHLILDMRPSSELKRFDLLLTRKDQDNETIQQIMELTASDDGWFRYEAILDHDISLSPVLLSKHGLTNKDQRTCRIRVVADKAPVARVISPNDEMSVSPDDTVDIKFEAHDDHGIAKAELVVYEETDTGELVEILSVQEIPLGEQELEKHILASAKLDLTKLELAEGTNISYAIRVTDNRLLTVDPKRSVDPESSSSPSEGTPSGNSEPKAESQLAAADVNKPTEQLTKQPEKETDNPNAGSDKAETKESDEKSDNPGSEAKSEPSKNTESGIADSDAENPSNDGPNKQVAENKPTDSPDEENVGQPKATASPASKDSSDKTKELTSEDQPTAVAANQEPDAKSDQTEPSKSATGEKTETDTTESENAQAVSQAKPKDDGASPMDKEDNEKSYVADKDEDVADKGDEPNATVDPSSQLASISSPARSSPVPTEPRSMESELQLGQNTESNRMRLTIKDRVTAASDAGKGRRSETMEIRKRLTKVDKALETAESILFAVKEEVDDADKPRKYKLTDGRLKRAELIIGGVRKETKGTPFDFVGLQLVELGNAHLTPARDRVFVLIQDPGSNPDRNVLQALHHVSRARELLAALTKQFEEYAREVELAKSLEEVAKIYEVYVEKAHKLLREQQQNMNPLRRKMAVYEVEEDYLERYKQVLEMRRDLMSEFGRILADDPRLLGKYMDMIKRRQSSFRDRLTKLYERQEDLATELNGWLRIDEAQRPDVWQIVSEIRLQSAKPLASEASRLESRTISQLPLNMAQDAGTSGLVIEMAKQVALNARASSVKARALMQQALEDDDAKAQLVSLADDLAYCLTEFDAALEQLGAENEGIEEVGEFVSQRLAESQALAEKADAWTETVTHIKDDQFHGLIAVDQQRLGIETDDLRLAMADIESEVDNLFGRDATAPPEVKAIARELLIVMESITFNQAAATYEAREEQLEKAEAQQTMAVEGFARAEQLFDKLRRTVAEILDERDPEALPQLQDPTLDQFLEQLEREPRLAALLGIPNRPRNIRAVSEWLLWQQQGDDEGTGGKRAASEAMERAKRIALGEKKEREKEKEELTKRRDGSNEPLTEQELKRFALAEKTEEELEKMLRMMEEKAKQPDVSDEEKKQLEKRKRMLAALLQQARDSQSGQPDWQELAESDQMKAILKAAAEGKPIPDNQWNTLMSSLDKGLWQVRGQAPPEDYRKAIEQYQNQIRRLLKTETANAK